MSFTDRIDFWKQIQDTPRKMKVGHRARSILAQAGKVELMDRSSLESFRAELEEGVAAYNATSPHADGHLDPDVKEKLEPLSKKLEEVISELAKRPADEARVSSGFPHPPPPPPAEAVIDAQAVPTEKPLEQVLGPGMRVRRRGRKEDHR